MAAAAAATASLLVGNGQESAVEARKREREAEAEVETAAEEEEALKLEARKAAADADAAAAAERVARNRVAALEAEAAEAAAVERDPRRLRPAMHRPDDDSAVVEGEEEEDEESLFLVQGEAGYDTGSPAGWGSPRRQVVVHDDQCAIFIALHGHTYTAEKRTGCVYHTPEASDVRGYSLLFHSFPTVFLLFSVLKLMMFDSLWRYPSVLRWGGGTPCRRSSCSMTRRVNASG